MGAAFGSGLPTTHPCAPLPLPDDGPEYDAPAVQSNLLAYCPDPQAASCPAAAAQQVADAFCTSVVQPAGFYERAEALSGPFKLADGERTVNAAGNQTCDPDQGACTAFAYIRCGPDRDLLAPSPPPQAAAAPPAEAPVPAAEAAAAMSSSLSAGAIAGIAVGAVCAGAWADVCAACAGVLPS